MGSGVVSGGVQHGTEAEVQGTHGTTGRGAGRPLGALYISSDHFTCTLPCDALAVHPYMDHIVVASVAGPETSVKAFRALLHEKSLAFYAKAQDMHAGDFKHAYKEYRRAPGAKYRTHTCRLGLHMAHMIAIADYPGLMPSVSDEALWRELRDTRFTTPILRNWVPWLRHRMEMDWTLNYCRAFGCRIGILRITPEKLDGIVTLGVRQGFLKLEDTPYAL